MKEADFAGMIIESGDCLENEKRFRAFLNDYFPGEQSVIHCLINLYSSTGSEDEVVPGVVLGSR